MTDTLTEPNFWKRCSTCKKEIGFSESYYVCSVSTCRHERKGFRFCSVECWDAHLGFANHREAWAEDKVSPSKLEYLKSVQSTEGERSASEVRSPIRKIVESHPKSGPPLSSASIPTTETLIVVSKVKALIRDHAGFNASQCFIDALTKVVADESARAVAHAKDAGRKTVMGRDIKRS